MSVSKLPEGSFVAIAKDSLQYVIDHLRRRGYRTIGPQVSESAVIYDDLDNIAQLPLGVIDLQDGGHYRLKQDSSAGYFDHVVGPHSVKNYVFPPRETLLNAARTDGGWEMQTPTQDDPPLAFIGVRSCDLHALAIQDRVFLEGEYVDLAYKSRREQLFLLAVNCRRAAATCFCHSMKTGPAVKSGFDLSLFELDDCFVVEVGTTEGGDALDAADWKPCTSDQLRRARELPVELEEQMRERSASTEIETDKPAQRSLDTTDIRDLLLDNLGHPRWQSVAERCLACANCTLVCPTCFCSSVEEVTDLTGDNVQRERSWASCFTAEHSYMNSGTVRKTIAARYRQWLTHKLGSWIDQFGVSGCVGCGRCITWCPVGIDLTEEVQAIRDQTGS